jgi:hypothetical protein
MATKKVENSGASKVAPTPKGGKVSSSNDKIVPSKACAASTEAAESPAAEGHVPNAETAEVLRDARDGKNLLHYESLEEMFKDLDI